MSIIVKSSPFRGPSFGLKNRTARYLWKICWALLFRTSPVPFFAWRSHILRCWGAKIGRDCHIYPDVAIWAPWQLMMGDYSCLGPRVNCYNMGRIEIGNRVIISQGVHICTGSHDYKNRSFQLYTQPIRIESDVWICTEAFLSPGVTVEEGAVIGARSVVTRSQAAWMVAAGNPCRPIKPRLVST